MQVGKKEHRKANWREEEEWVHGEDGWEGLAAGLAGGSEVHSSLWMAFRSLGQLQVKL